MRIAVLADIHGNLPALEAVVADIRRRGVDSVVNLGDSLSGPLLPLETAQFLMATGWLHLAGNHERQLLARPVSAQGPSDAFALSCLSPNELSWIASLPCTATVGDDVLLCHGTPTVDNEYLLETVESTHVRLATPSELSERLGAVASPLVLCGHSHVPRAVRAPGGPLVVNPGSVGLQAYEDDHPSPHVMAVGSPDARYAILERRGASWVSALLSVPYRHEEMARLASRRERADWAAALASGNLGAAD